MPQTPTMYQNPGMDITPFIDPYDPYANDNRNDQRMPVPPADRRRNAGGPPPASPPGPMPPASPIQSIYAQQPPPAPGPMPMSAPMQLPGGFPQQPAPTPPPAPAPGGVIPPPALGVGGSPNFAGGISSLIPGQYGTPAGPMMGPPAPMPALGLPPMSATPGQTVRPAADNAAMMAYLDAQRQGGVMPGAAPPTYLPTNMAFAGGPGVAPPMPGLESIADDAGNSYFVGAGSPGTASNQFARTNAMGIQGMPSFDVFRQQMLHSGIGANTPALMQSYAALADRMSRPQATMGALANDTTRTQAQFGPNGLAGRELDMRGRELDNRNFGNTPAGRQMALENAAIAGFLNQPPGQPRRPLSAFIADANAIANSGLLASGAPGGATPPPPAPNGAAPRPPGPTTPPPAGPRPPGSPPPAGPYASPGGGPAPLPYEGILDQLDSIHGQLPPGAGNTVGSFLARLNRDNPGFAQSNFPAIQAYLQDRYGRSAFDQAAAGVRVGLGGIPYAQTPGWTGFWGANPLSVLQGATTTIMGGNPWTEDLEGRAMLGNLMGQRR